MLKTLLANTIYVQVRKNALRVRHIEQKREREILASKPFTTTRLLVGQFQEAASLLKKGISEIVGPGLFKTSPAAVIHPLEMVEGGLSEVEERVFRELALAAGSRDVVVHIGATLTDADVVALIGSKQK